MGPLGVYAAGGSRQTSIFTYARLNPVCSCVQMFVPRSHDLSAVGCRSTNVLMLVTLHGICSMHGIVLVSFLYLSVFNFSILSIFLDWVKLCSSNLANWSSMAGFTPGVKNLGKSIDYGKSHPRGKKIFPKETSSGSRDRF